MKTIEENTNRSHEKYIDLEKVIRSKSERTWKLLPGFVVRYLKRIIHEEELNAIMSKLKGSFGLNFVNGGINELGFKIKIIGEANIPVSGRHIIASNHPLGGPEGLALMSEVGKKNKNLKFIVNDVLLNLENIKDLFVPVNKHGVNPRENIKIIDDVLRSDTTVLTFPFGLVSRKRKGIIEDLEWKKTFISWAKIYKRDVIPVYINGRNSNFFYNLANMRKFFRIKTNIEMLFLVNEMYKQKNAILEICFGNPISFTTFDTSLTTKQWAEKVRKHVYSMAQKGPIVFEK
ncbi:glycerol acyltransferase [Bacteroidota bacterium]